MMDSPLVSVILLVLTETFANVNLRWFAQTNVFNYLVQGVLGYVGVVFFMYRALSSANLLYINGLWDGVSAIVVSLTSYFLLGERLETGQEYAGLLLILAGMLFMTLGKKN